MERLKPYYACTDFRSSLGPVTDPKQEGKFELEQLLNSKTIHDRTYYLVERQELGQRSVGTGG